MKGMKGSRAQLGVNAFQREMDESMARMMQDMHGPGYVGQADIDGALVGGASLKSDEFATLSAIAAGGPLP